MTLRYGFFNSIDGDRKYDALDMSSIFDGIIEDGVFATIGKMFAVTPGSGLEVLVDSGKAWFNHTWTSNDAKIPLSIDTPDVTMDRIDAVVLEVNNDNGVRANSIKIVKGSASTRPNKPNLTETDTIHQHPLAYVTVTHGAKSILAKDIEFVVGKDPCPFVTGPLQVIQIDAVFAQWESEFDYWFENVKSNLEGDVAANLQRQIDERVKIVDKASDAHAIDFDDDQHWMTPKKVKIAGDKFVYDSIPMGAVIQKISPTSMKGFALANGSVLPDENELKGLGAEIRFNAADTEGQPGTNTLPGASNLGKRTGVTFFKYIKEVDAWVHIIRISTSSTKSIDVGHCTGKNPFSPDSPWVFDGNITTPFDNTDDMVGFGYSNGNYYIVRGRDNFEDVYVPHLTKSVDLKKWTDIPYPNETYSLLEDKVPLFLNDGVYLHAVNAAGGNSIVLKYDGSSWSTIDLGIKNSHYCLVPTGSDFWVFWVSGSNATLNWKKISRTGSELQAKKSSTLPETVTNIRGGAEDSYGHILLAAEVGSSASAHVAAISCFNISEGSPKFDLADISVINLTVSSPGVQFDYTEDSIYFWASDYDSPKNDIAFGWLINGENGPRLQISEFNIDAASNKELGAISSNDSNVAMVRIVSTTSPLYKLRHKLPSLSGDGTYFFIKVGDTQ